MAEIGSGLGSSYPAALDTDNVPEDANDFVTLDWGNDVAADIVAIEGALGINPQGGYATVAARLAAISASSGGGVPRGLASARPAANAGTFYKSTDTGILEYSDGTNWYPLFGG